jgi:hypothetical protein
MSGLGTDQPPFPARRKLLRPARLDFEKTVRLSHWARHSAATPGHASQCLARVTEQPKTRGGIAVARRPSFSRSHNRSVFRVVDTGITAESFIKAGKYVPPTCERLNPKTRFPETRAPVLVWAVP